MDAMSLVFSFLFLVAIRSLIMKENATIERKGFSVILWIIMIVLALDLIDKSPYYEPPIWVQMMTVATVAAGGVIVVCLIVSMIRQKIRKGCLINEVQPTDSEREPADRPVPKFEKLWAVYLLRFEYTHVDVCIIKGQEPDFSGLYIGCEVELVREPDNSNDKNAVKVVSKNNSAKIGYLYRGKLQDMANDYLKKHEHIVGYIDSKDSEGHITLALGFYRFVRNVLDEGLSSGRYKRFKLTSNRNADMQDVIGYTQIGAEVDACYDEEKEKYLASVNGEDIGYFPKSANAMLKGYPEILVDETEDDDNEKMSIWVCVGVKQ